MASASVGNEPRDQLPGLRWVAIVRQRTERELLEAVRNTELDSRARFENLVFLRRVATTASIPVLGESVGSSNHHVRATALRVLADLGGDEAVSFMEGALESSSANTVDWAAAGLEKLGAVRAVSSMVRCLAQRRAQLVGDAEKTLTEALGVLGDDRAVEELTVSAMQPRRRVRRLGLKALARIGTSQSEALAARSTVCDAPSKPDAKRYGRRLTCQAALMNVLEPGQRCDESVGLIDPRQPRRLPDVARSMRAPRVGGAIE